MKRERSEFIADAALKALLYEAATTPKPGLVDALDSGAHDDMNLYTFLDSAVSLRGYFSECAELGGAAADPRELFPRLKEAGIRAEERMLRATGGVNTHKGAIFSLGLLCGAAGMYRETAEILRAAGEMAGDSLEALSGMTLKEAKTEGERQFALYGRKSGVRGEAAEGFPSVRKYALPAFRERMENGKDPRAACLYTLVLLMTSVRDSNVLKRGGEEGILWMHERAKRVLKEGCGTEELTEMNREMIRRNLSPGGCADLLAVTCFLYFLEREEFGGIGS